MEELGFENSEFSDTMLRVEIFPDGCLDINSHLVATGNNCDAALGVKVRILPICSPVLAAKSPFFYKLFLNGMKESQEKNFTLGINVSEESGLMDVLNFMYCHKLRATTIPELLKVWTVANKFQATCCMRHCCDLLLKLPMTLKSALEYLNLPSDESTQPLRDAASKFTSRMYNLKEKENDAMSLSLSDVEILLASDKLVVYAEDNVLSFIFRWTSKHCPDAVEFQETFKSLVSRFLRFHYLGFETLNKILASTSDWYKGVTEKVHEALFFKAALSSLNQQQQPPQQRVYILRPLKLLHFHYSSPHCVVFLDLKKDDIHPDKNITSEYVSLSAGGKKADFCVVVQFRKGKLGVYMHQSPGAFLLYHSVQYELAVMTKGSGYTLMYSTWRAGYVGWEIEWSKFIAEDSPYFTDGTVRFRLEVELKPRIVVRLLP